MSVTYQQPAPPVSQAAPRAGLLGLGMILLSLGHMTTDLFSSAIATLQPVLGERYQLSLAQAGILGGVFMFASSVLQLPFGILSDRVNSRLFSAGGVLTAGVFLSLLGTAGSFPALMGLAFVGGMGVAAFHPQSTKEAARLSGERRGMGVAVFITAGTFGLALGPPYFAFVIDRVGFDRFAIAMVPALAVAALLLWRLPPPAPPAPGSSRGVDWGALRACWRPLSAHYWLVVLRSVVQLAFGQFLALYLVRERGMSMRDASFVLALFFLAASVGSFFGGGLADRFGGRSVVVLSTVASPPFLAGFLYFDGALSLVSLFVGGVFLLLTIPVNLVMAQDLVPTQAGTVSSLMMGFAWGFAGIAFIPPIGWLADSVGLETVLWYVSAAPLVGLTLALRLPRPAARR